MKKMRHLFAFAMIVFCAEISLGETVEGYTYLKASANGDGLVTAEFYDQPPFSLPEFNQYLLDQVLKNDPSDVIDLHGGKLWEGPLRIDYTIELEDNDLKSFDIEFEGLPMPQRPLSIEYPKKARFEEIEGYVLISISITDSGKVEDVTVIESTPEGVFDRTVLRTYRRWKFVMPTVDGKPIPVKTNHRIFFKLVS